MSRENNSQRKSFWDSKLKTLNSNFNLFSTENLFRNVHCLAPCNVCIQGRIQDFHRWGANPKVGSPTNFSENCMKVMKIDWTGVFLTPQIEIEIPASD